MTSGSWSSRWTAWIADVGSDARSHRYPVLATSSAWSSSGDGPARGRWPPMRPTWGLSRVRFVGAVSDAVLYRWLRTARVVITLGRRLAPRTGDRAGRPASRLCFRSPDHREAAERPAAASDLRPRRRSPLDVADAIEEELGSRSSPSAFSPPSWQSVADSTLTLYEGLIGADHRPARERRARALAGVPADLRAQDEARGERLARARMNGGRKWR